MITIEGAHEFSLYRSGWSGDEVPWPDNQLWARVSHVQIPPIAGEHHFQLHPEYGSAASYYQVRLLLDESPEVGWAAARVSLTIDNYSMQQIPLPLAWYTADPADWPSGIARFPEPHGFHPPHFLWPKPGCRGVWTLAVRRSA